MTTQIQDTVIEKLAKKGFFISKMIDGNQPETEAALMTKVKGPRRFYAEVEADGSVNGESLTSFLKGLADRLS